MLPAVLVGEEIECTLEENEASINYEIVFLSTQRNITFV